MKRLIVNADDFGLSPGITEGIIEAHTRGIVTSTSIVASGADFENAVELARQHPDLVVGLHLTLVEERLLTRAKPFAASYVDFARGVLAGSIPLDDVEEEMRAQVRQCIAAGLHLTHLDSHQHVHALPTVMEIVVRLAREYRVPRVRVPFDSPWRAGTVTSSRFFGKLVLCALARNNLGAVRHAGLMACDRMLGLFESGALTERRLLRLLDRQRDGITELMCHPAREDDACRSRYAHWRFRWSDELAALTSPAVRARLTERGIVLS
jgi:predicted glycoside hydrolase/deacetylase ChbG (UPF0249 family)